MDLLLLKMQMRKSATGKMAAADTSAMITSSQPIILQEMEAAASDWSLMRPYHIALRNM